MFDLLSIFENFPPDLDVRESPVDSDFITNFLQPYFHDLPREVLAAKLAELIALDQRNAGHRCR